MKICNKCGLEKEDIEFRKPRNGCIACERAAALVYRSVPGVLETAAAKMREKRKDPSYKKGEKIVRDIYMADPSRCATLKKRMLLNLLKLDRPCYDCGGMFPIGVTDWDHLPQFEKTFCLGSGQASHSLEECVDEINKCQLVCSNCHRLRTQARRGKKI